MKKKTMAILSCIILASAFTTIGCNNTVSKPTSTQQPTEAATAATEDSTIQQATGKATLQVPTDAVTDFATEEPTADITDYIYEFVDETVTNPTVAPIEETTNDHSVIIPSDITADDLIGNWKPLTAVSVTDGKELSFESLFGSSYGQYGGSLVIREDANFTIGMGAAIPEKKSSGTFTLSDFNLLVTYNDKSVDTYLYIPSFQGKQVIKTQINNAYVYFYKA